MQSRPPRTLLELGAYYEAHDRLLAFSLYSLREAKGAAVDDLARKILAFLEHRRVGDAAERYSRRVARLQELQQEFDRTGRYAASSYAEVERVDLEDYNLALLLSTVVARHRFEVFERLRSFCRAPVGGPHRLLSVGYGTGLELHLASRDLPGWSVEAFEKSADAHAYATDLLGFLGGPVDSLRPDAFPLEVVLALTTRAPKKVGSTEGMERSRTTSPYFDNWVASTQTDFSAAKDAVLGHDFQKLATIAEHSCLKMHALMMSTLPGLIYWNGGTLEAIHALRALRDDGVEVFFTVDAGPQVKAICPAGHSARIRQALDALDGVEETLVTALGPGAI